MLTTECNCLDTKSTTGSRRFPTLDRDLRVRRFENADTHRIHNLFLEETRCLLWPMFVQTVRSPPAVLLHLVFVATGVLLVRSCVLALFGIVVAFSGIFLYIYRWFYKYLTSSLKGDLANITQHYLSKENSNFLVAEFDNSIVGFIAVEEKSKNIAAVRRISVETCFRGKRKDIAKRLLQEALKFCQACDYKELVMELPGSNETKTYGMNHSKMKIKHDVFIARQG